MTRKRIILIISILALPVIFIFVARFMNWYASFKLTSSNMDPTYKIGQKFFASSLVDSHKNDAIAYYATPAPMEEATENYIALARIVGEEGDEIELRDGILYVNGKLADDTIKLGYFFLINKKDLNFKPTPYDLENRIFDYSDTLTILNFSYYEIDFLHLTNKCRRKIDNSTTLINPELFGEQHAGKKWSFDNFGPLIVPNGQLFLLGDNRSNSTDSRLRGFTSRKDVVAKIFE